MAWAHMAAFAGHQVVAALDRRELCALRAASVAPECCGVASVALQGSLCRAVCPGTPGEPGGVAGVAARRRALAALAWLGPAGGAEGARLAAETAAQALVGDDQRTVRVEAVRALEATFVRVAAPVVATGAAEVAALALAAQALVAAVGDGDRFVRRVLVDALGAAAGWPGAGSACGAQGAGGAACAGDATVVAAPLGPVDIRAVVAGALKRLCSDEDAYVRRAAQATLADLAESGCAPD